MRPRLCAARRPMARLRTPPSAGNLHAPAHSPPPRGSGWSCWPPSAGRPAGSGVGNGHADETDQSGGTLCGIGRLGLGAGVLSGVLRRVFSAVRGPLRAVQPGSAVTFTRPPEFADLCQGQGRSNRLKGPSNVPCRPWSSYVPLAAERSGSAPTVPTAVLERATSGVAKSSTTPSCSTRTASPVSAQILGGLTSCKPRTGSGSGRWI
jgi:hypothetical protein